MMERIGIEEALKQAAERVESDNYLITPDAVLVLQSDETERQLLSKQEPFYFDEGRLLRVKQGRLQMKMNLEQIDLQAHDILMFPPRSIVEPLMGSDDLQTEVLVLKALPGITAEQHQTLLPHGVMHLHLPESDWQRQSTYFNLLADLMRQGMREAVSHLIISMLHDLQHISQVQSQRESGEKSSRSELLFHRFLSLANEHGFLERNVTFYSKRLLITPNHLSAIVRQQSQRTVLDWLTERTLAEAKILLRHSNQMIYEIAEHLNFSEHSAFSLYFKKHTGMTPLEYRERG
jgi:AraC-like DNA-binding protein